MSGFGGGFNPRRLRLEFGGLLCQCDCHSSCPVVGNRGSVSIPVWRELCTCPGAEAERARHDQAGTSYPDFDFDFDFDFDQEWASPGEGRNLAGKHSKPPGPGLRARPVKKSKPCTSPSCAHGT